MYLKRLNREDPYDVQLGTRLFCNSPQYMVDTFGRPPTTEDGRRFMSDVPPDSEAQDILLFAIFEKEAAIGLIQVQRRYSRPELSNIGLLLLDAAYRRRHLGCAVVAHLSRQARNWEPATHWSVAVMESNRAAVAFWRHVGFQPIAENVLLPHHRSRATLLERPIKQRKTCVPTSQLTPVAARNEDNWLSARLHKH